MFVSVVRPYFVWGGYLIVARSVFDLDLVSSFFFSPEGGFLMHKHFAELWGAKVGIPYLVTMHAVRHIIYYMRPLFHCLCLNGCS